MPTASKTTVPSFAPVTRLRLTCCDHAAERHALLLRDPDLVAR